MKDFLKMRRWMVMLALGLMTMNAMAQEPVEDIEEEITEIDCSDKIANNDFSSTTTGWTMLRIYGQGNAQMCPAGTATNCIEYWCPTQATRGFDYYQDITGLENGKYVLRASMWYRGTDYSCGVYAMNAGFGEVFKSCGNVTGSGDKTQADNRKEYQTSTFVVCDGKLRVGFKNHNVMTGDWFGADYIKLIKVGEATDAELSKARANVALTNNKMPAEPIGKTGVSGANHEQERYAGNNNSFDAGNILYFKITGLTKGTYRVSFYAVANVKETDFNKGSTYYGDNIAQVFANNTAKDITIYKQDNCDLSCYPHTLVCEVSSSSGGELIYGIKNLKTGGQWYEIRNISLQKVDVNSDCLKFTSPDYAQVCFSNYNNNTVHDFEYSIDGEIWYDYGCATGASPNLTTYAASYIDISHNQKAYFRAKTRTGMLSDGNDFNRNSSYRFFHGKKNGQADGNINVSGNVMSLIDPYCISLEVSKTCFSRLFEGMSTMVTAPRLPATTVGPWCYEYMFKDCSKLVVAPDIPATVYKAGCCAYMFEGCNKLQYANFSFENFDNSSGKSLNDIFNDRGTNPTTCHLWCPEGFTTQTSLRDHVTVHNKDGVGMANWLCLNNIGSANATVKLENIGADFGIEYSYDGSTWHSTIGGTRKVTKDVECDDCHGDGFTTEKCGTCHGVGTVTPPCGRCNGNKTIQQTCSICNGTGKKTCTAANCVNGKVPCTYSKSIKINGYTADAVCTGLDGNGYLVWRGIIHTYYFTCPQCSNNTAEPNNKNNNKLDNPPSTKGTGRVNCATCSGTGKVSCPTTETVTCPACSGSGLAAPVTCGTCSGSKTKYTGCTACGGSGEAYTKGGITMGTGTVRKEVDEPDPAASVEITLNTTTQSHVFFRTTLNHSDTENSAFSSSKYMHFVMSGRIAASGEVNSLLKADCNVTALPHHAFYHLFDGCSSLEQAPILSSTTLGVSCYEGMFKGCTNLFASPVLNAETLVAACYKEMFNGCSNLRSIICNFKQWDPNGKTDHYIDEETGEEYSIFTPDASNATYHWVTGVYRDKECNFNNSNDIEFIYDENHIPCDNEVRWFSGDEDYLAFTWDGSTASTVALNTKGIISNFAKLVFRTKQRNRSTGKYEWGKWYEYKFSKKSDNSGATGHQIKLNADSTTVQFRAGSILIPQNVGGYRYYNAENNHTFSTSSSAYYQFAFTGGNIAASGNISSLLSYNGSNDQLPDYAFCNLFNGCSTLTTAPELPATNLGKSCYATMFANCTSLQYAPMLPAITLATSCYSEMFAGAGLVQVPNLPATTLASSCYSLMFYNCTKLVVIPTVLSSKKLFSNCYYGMFRGCSSITSAPVLPAVQLATACYQTMFFDCSALNTVPTILPAKQLAVECYRSMFNGCTSIVSAPELPATSLVKDCYYTMFKNCSNLKKISVQFTSWTDGSGNECTTDWVAGVPESGNFICPEGLGTDEYGPNRVPKNSTHKWNVIKNPFILFMATTNDGAKVMLKENGSIATKPNLEWSNSGAIGSWTPYHFNDELNMSGLGDIIMFRAVVPVSDCGTCHGTGLDGSSNPCNTCKGAGKIEDNNPAANTSFSQDDQNYFQFVTTGVTELSGDVSSLIQGKYHKEWTVPGFFENVPNNYAFYGLFKGNKKMSGKADLSFIRLTDHCYQSIYEDCENLSIAPDLPAEYVTPSCYEAMFKNCKKIITFPTVRCLSQQNAHAVSCFKEMFYGCSSLVDNIPASINNYVDESMFEGMFEGCTSLKTTPVMGVEYGAPTYCYKRMFAGCTSLKTGATFLTKSASGIGSFEAMYDGCTSLVSVPEFNLQNSYSEACFKNMFRNCKSLKSSPTLSIGLNNNCFEGMFENCTALESAPILSKVDLKPYCYKRMFAGCSRLYTAPTLPATTLQAGCYAEMFAGCANMRYMEVSFNAWDTSNTIGGDPDEPTTANATYHWVENVAPTGTFMSPASLPKQYDDSHIPFGWRSEDNGNYFYVEADAYQTISFEAPSGASILDLGLQYSYDKDTWTKYDNTYYTKVNIGDNNDHKRLYFRGSSGAVNKSLDNYFKISFDQDVDVKVGGNIMSLIDASMQRSTVPNYTFYRLFENAVKITDVSKLELPATMVGDYAYAEMFKGCSGISGSATAAPELPATTLGEHCYENLFAGWTGLTASPVLPANKLAEGCYNGIFNGCSNMKEITVGFTSWLNGSATENWVNGVSRDYQNCTFSCPGDLLSEAISDDLWGKDENYKFIYGPSKIPADADARWLIVLDVNVDFDYSTNTLTLSGGDNIHYVVVDEDPENLSAAPLLADVLAGTECGNNTQLNLSSWIDPVTDLSAKTYYAACTMAGLPAAMCGSVVRHKTVYAYPKYHGYCLADDVTKLKKSLFYAEKASSANFPVKIFVPDATYTIPAEQVNMVVGNNVSLIGESNGKTIIKTNAASAAPITIEGNNAYLQDMTFGNENASGYAFYNKGMYNTLNVAMQSGSSYLDNNGNAHAAMTPAWATGMASGYYAPVQKLMLNGGAINVVSDASVFLYEAGGGYDITESKVFYVSGGNTGFTLRAANQYGGFGPYFNIDAPEAPVYYVEPKDDGGNDLVEYVLPESIKLNANGFASFYYEEDDVTIGDETVPHRLKAIGASAFIGRCPQDFGSITLTHINDKDIIPSGTGVILFGTPGTTVHFYTDVTSTIGSYYTTKVMPTNQLTGTNVQIKPGAGACDHYYGLSGDKFRRLSATGTIKAHRAYFWFENAYVPASPAASAASANRNLRWGEWDGLWEDDDNQDLVDSPDETRLTYTAISNKITPTYTLTGQRTSILKGLIVKNGKVIMVK